MHQNTKFDWGIPKPFEGVMAESDIRKHHMRVKSKKDAYDLDPTTASPYDDMEQHVKFDWGVKKGGEFAQREHHHHKPDAYDYDKDTVSPYDAMPQHVKFDFGVPAKETDFAQIGRKHHHKHHH